MRRIQLNSVQLNAVTINSAGERWRGSHAGAPPVVPDVPDIPDIPEEPDVPSDPDVDENGYIIFADPEVKRILLAKGVGDGVGITKEAAMAVTTGFGTEFKESAIVSFDEMKYFTNAKYIYRDAFYRCGSLESINIPTGVEVIQATAFYACGKLSSIEGASNVKRVQTQAFRYCKALTSISLRSIEGIENSAFMDCKGLAVIIGLHNAATIANNAFDSCESLPYILLKSVTTIGSAAFANCHILAAAIINTSTPPSLGSSAFNGTPITSGSGYIYVPDASVESYKSATNWNTYASRIAPISQLQDDNPTLYAEIKEYL